jgi:aspartyl-tRNA(Asn)/glutamyl-tRNA(Gln) amidotransferase subunit A
VTAPPGIFIEQVEPASAGIALAVKDLFDTAGVRTTYGSAIFRNHVPDRTAIAVERLEAAGYVTVGKTNLHEFAWGITSENPHFGTVPNPLATGRIAGGSSGGSAAALAAGLADAALGTDSGGSIRIPAACCGVTGFKPTFGLVPADGCFPLAPSFDHVGPMGRDVDACERMLVALAPGFAPAPDVDLGELVVGLAWTATADPLVKERVERASSLFGQVRAIDVPFGRETYPVFSRECAETHAVLWREHEHEYGENVAHKLRRAFGVPDEEVAAGSAARDTYRAQVDETMDGLDLVVTPTLAMVAPPTGIGDLELRERMTQLTYPWNVVGAPALALPCGAAEDGLPASVQLVGKPGADAFVLATGRALERALANMLQAT